MQPCRNILIVDDEPDILGLVSYYLGRGNNVVRTAIDGVAALDAVASDLPDLIVLDLMLPGMTGWEVLQELRRDARSRRVPVVVLSARSEEEDAAAAKVYETADYIAKPFSPTDLVRRVEAVLERAPAAADPASGSGLSAAAG